MAAAGIPPRPAAFRLAATLPGEGAGLPLGPRGGMGHLRVDKNGFIYHRRIKNKSKAPDTILAWMASPEIDVDFDNPVKKLSDFDPETIYIKMPRYEEDRGIIGLVTTDTTPATAANGYSNDVIFDPAFIFNTEGDIIRATVSDRFSTRFRLDRDREAFYPVKGQDLGEIADVIRRMNYESMTAPVNAATALRLAQPVSPNSVTAENPVNFGRFALPAGPQVNVQGQYGPRRNRKTQRRKKSRKNHS